MLILRHCAVDRNLLYSNLHPILFTESRIIPNRSMETIGSRLRKRRRTSPMPNDESGDSSPPPKRAQSTRGAPTRGKRGQAAIAQQDVPASARAEPQSPAHAAPLESGEPPSVASPVSAPIIQQPPEDSLTPNHQLPIEQHPPLQGAQPQDINTVIADIINHGETVENHCGSQGYATMGMVDTESYSQLGASLHLKLQSLPILDNLVDSDAFV